jgi:hypothetical protein
MKQNLKVFLIGMFGIALTFSSVLIGCYGAFSAPDVTGSSSSSSDADNRVLSRHNYLALLKTQNNHKVSIDELQSIVSTLLETNESARSVVPAGSFIKSANKLEGLGEKRFAPSSSARSTVEVEEEPVEVYEFIVSDSEGESTGFVLASNDVRVGNFLAIAEGSLEETDEEFVALLNANLEDYIDASIAEYDSISDDEILSAIEKAIEEDSQGARALSDHWSGVNPNGWTVSGYSSNFAVQKSPLLLTKWGQGARGAYSSSGYAYNNLVKVEIGDYYAGCGPVAIAQIIAYNNYINSYSGYKKSAFNYSNVGTWTGSYNLSSIRELPTIRNSSATAAQRGQVAHLLYQIGKIAGASYSPTATGINAVNARNTFNTLGYTTSYYTNVTSLSETSTWSTITYNTSLETIKNALNNNRPFYTRGTSSDGGGHAWVTDGYGSMTQYVEFYNNGQSTTITLNNCLMVHCNLGWDGNANGWYIYGIFDTAHRTLLESSSGGKGNYSTSTAVIIPQKP